MTFAFLKNTTPLQKREGSTNMPCMLLLYKQKPGNKLNHMYIHQWENDHVTNSTFILEYYAAVKRNDLGHCVTTWTDSNIHC